MLEVAVTISRGKGDSHTYQLTESGESKKGTFKMFSPAKECPDMPEFAKVYVNIKRNGKANGKS